MNTAILPLRSRGESSHLRVPMVCSNPAKNWLGLRMDLSRPTTHCTQESWCRKSTISPLPNETLVTYHHRKSCWYNEVTWKLHTPTVLQARTSIWRSRIKKVPTTKVMGPCYQAKGRSPYHPHQSKYPTIPNWTRGTSEVHQRTSPTQDYLTIKKPICSSFLFHQKEEWKATPRPRLLTHQWMDNQKLLPSTSYSPAD